MSATDRPIRFIRKLKVHDLAKACRYEPELNPTYAELAAHYHTAVLPARPYKPRDKAKAEVAVQVVERWILARLRHQRFFGLPQLNAAISLLLADLNHRPFKKLPGSRHSQFLTHDQPALKPLPPVPYEYAEWKQARVNIDYHIEVDGHCYSVPYRLVRQRVDVRLTASAIEVLYKGERVASHLRSHRKGSFTTVSAHMPLSHQRHLEWTPGRFLTWAQTIGPQLAAAVRPYRRRLGRRWYIDEVFCFPGSQKRYLYRVVDQHGQVVDVLLRDKRDRASAEAFFRRALKQTGVIPHTVVSDHHQPYVKALTTVIPTACHIRTGLHRARGETTKPIERSHVATRDRLRCSRGLKTRATGQRFLESFEGLRALRCAHVRLRELVPRYRPTKTSRHERARAVVTAMEVLGQRLTKVRCPELL